MTPISFQWTVFAVIGILYAAVIVLHALHRVSLRTAAGAALVVTGALAGWVVVYAPGWALFGVALSAVVLATTFLSPDEPEEAKEKEEE